MIQTVKVNLMRIEPRPCALCSAPTHHVALCRAVPLCPSCAKKCQSAIDLPSLNTYISKHPTIKYIAGLTTKSQRN